MKKKAIWLLAVLLLLTGCQKAPAEKPAPGEDKEKEVLQPEPKIVVYPGAVEDYLGEITDYSWEQVHKPEYVLIHFCSAVVNHPDDPYNIDHVRQTFIDADVSIHYIVERDGTVRCYIPEDRTAWHAGVGQWKGEEKYTNDLNRYSIGIELVAIGSQEDMAQFLTPRQYKALDQSLVGFTEEQYTALSALVADICRRNEIPLDREHVFGHEEYNPKKPDPGELFDWSRIIPAAP